MIGSKAKRKPHRPMLTSPAGCGPRRDTALILLGFWRGFRSDELCRLQAEHVQAVAGSGITLYLQRSKGDRDNLGKTFQTGIVAPVPGAGLYRVAQRFGAGARPGLQGIDRWGNLGEAGRHSANRIPLLRQALERAGIPAERHTSHSLRRGFATWAHHNGWDLKSLMNYVGWKDVKSAMRYVEATPFTGMSIAAEKRIGP